MDGSPGCPHSLGLLLPRGFLPLILPLVGLQLLLHAIAMRCRFRWSERAASMITGLLCPRREQELRAYGSNNDNEQPSRVLHAASATRAIACLELPDRGHSPPGR